MKRLSFILTALLSVAVLFSNAQANKANPYDFVGQLHNQALSQFQQEYSKARLESERTKIEDVFNYTSDKLQISDKDAITYGLKNSLYPELLHKSLRETTSILNSNGRINSTTASYLNRVDDAIELYFDEDLSVLQGQLVKIETEVLNIPRMPEKDKGVILAAISTARYSAAYWKNNPMIKPASGHAMAKSACCNGKGIVKADVSGAIGGAVAGAITGAVVVPVVGSVPGWVAGGVVGGVGSSVAEVVNQLWDWLF
jgi:hypothetical protein